MNPRLEHAERRWRIRLDSWQFWVGVTYVGLAVAYVILLHVVNVQAKEAAERAASQKAANANQVAGCYQQIKDAPRVKTFLHTFDLLAANDYVSARDSIRSSNLALEIAPDPILDPIRRDTRIQARIRVQRAGKVADVVEDFRKITRASTPTLAKCDRLAKMLHVNPAPYRPKPKRK